MVTRPIRLLGVGGLCDAANRWVCVSKAVAFPTMVWPDWLAGRQALAGFLEQLELEKFRIE
jgi:hypothetical protein